MSIIKQIPTNIYGASTRTGGLVQNILIVRINGNVYGPLITPPGNTPLVINRSA